VAEAEQKLGNLGFARIFHIPKTSAKRYLPGITPESFAQSAVLRRRKARNMSVLLATQHAKSASALVTMTRIVWPIGSHPLRLAMYLDKMSVMLTIPASR
jgi:hypothetical protein